MITGSFYGYATKDRATFAVSLAGGDFKHDRLLKLKAATVNAAELHAAEYALAAIAHNVPVSLSTCNSYVPKMLEKNAEGVYKAKPEKNVELVARVRQLADKFSDLEVKIVKAVHLKEMQALVRNTK